MTDTGLDIVQPVIKKMTVRNQAVKSSNIIISIDFMFEGFIGEFVTAIGTAHDKSRPKGRNAKGKSLEPDLTIYSFFFQRKIIK
jgi:hypothetical protein